MLYRTSRRVFETKDVRNSISALNTGVVTTSQRKRKLTIVLLDVHHLDLAQREPVSRLVHPPALRNLRENAVPAGVQERAQVLRPLHRMLDDVQRTGEQARSQ